MGSFVTFSIVDTCGCPTNEWAPVCGDDGFTYITECKARCDKTKIVCKGACPCKNGQGQGQGGLYGGNDDLKGRQGGPQEGDAGQYTGTNSKMMFGTFKTVTTD